jgi:hypothetical protein
VEPSAPEPTAVGYVAGNDNMTSTDDALEQSSVQDEWSEDAMWEEAMREQAAHVHALNAWHRPESMSVLEALRENCPWAVRRLKEAARGTKVSVGPIEPPTFRSAKLAGAVPSDEPLTPGEIVAIDILADAVIYEWLEQNPGWTRRSR